LSGSPRRGDVWATDSGVDVLVIASTAYNEIPSEPTVIVAPVFSTEPDTGFGVDLVDGWVASSAVGLTSKPSLTSTPCSSRTPPGKRAR